MNGRTGRIDPGCPWPDPFRHGLSGASRKLRRSASPWGLCPQTPRIYRLRPIRRSKQGKKTRPNAASRLLAPCSAPPRRSGRFPASPCPPGGSTPVYHTRSGHRAGRTKKQETLPSCTSAADTTGGWTAAPHPIHPLGQSAHHSPRTGHFYCGRNRTFLLCVDRRRGGRTAAKAGVGPAPSPVIFWGGGERHS